jgi:NarL family two-component system response regulator LiaR
MKKNRNIRILVVDDHSITRDGVKALLSIYEDLDYAGGANNGKEAVEMCKKIKPDVVLMDIEMPVMDGIDAASIIREENPAIKIIALTSFADKKLVGAAIKAGAISYILKNVSPDKIAETIRDAFAGKSNLSPEATQAIIEEVKEPSPNKFSFTKQEMNILNLIVKGYSNKTIASKLYISQHTVKFHIGNILSKLGAETRTEAAAIATRNKLVS